MSGLADCLDFPMAGLQGHGLGGYTSLPLSEAQEAFAGYVTALTPFGAGADKARDGMTELYGNGYEIAKGDGGPGSVSVGEAVRMVPKGYAATAVKNAYRDGYFVRKTASESIASSSDSSISASSPPATSSASTPDVIASKATQGGPGKEPTTLSTIQDALKVVIEMAPALAAAKQQQAAQKLLAKQAAGQQIFKNKRSRNLWLLGGVGVLAMLGIVYAITKK